MNINRTQRRAMSDSLKFHAPNSPEYIRLINEIKELDRKYHNYDNNHRSLTKDQMLAILSTPVHKS